eukprot:CAMPEP_0201497412 /NCGR_PEP_ID=MMETSP0151_2-20130828/65491_1 /ASSEMBLY_ACC=CAM_ASM_000257 /TAXON_ID=200890 /ORGANISM="Paramoeba atlantica, Strain 621/1 / CCAP 1560/9" /LENGTH=117 /DNA_ID=CAMNT_0047888079 /DNA_START=209 /DNA_END=559 /DNA_ORIENTATION=+
MATIRLPTSNQPLLEDFILQISIMNPKQPRMWIEKREEKREGEKSEGEKRKEEKEPEREREEKEGGHQAAMLCFYPNFDFPDIVNKEYIFLFDRSHSMKGETVEDARRVLRLSLQLL